MLLARRGYRVLLVDRASFPSDTVSTHLLHPPGVAALGRWGLLERLIASGCPPIHTYRFDFGPFALSGAPGTTEAPVAYGPRRTTLDQLLVEAAAEAGAEVRQGFTVTDVVVDGGRVTGVRGHGPNGRAVTEQARVVVGPTAATPGSPGPSSPPSTTRSHRCCAAPTATGPGRPPRAASRPGSGPAAPLPPGPPATT
jgi:2-polyprenyl-6-methoxyphenol hydroxylase-like FAD-dependent oxidoreductase